MAACPAATLPAPIIGGCYIALFGTIGALGIQALTRADMQKQRNVMIVGFSFLMALGLPGWVEAQKELPMLEFLKFLKNIRFLWI